MGVKIDQLQLYRENSSKELERIYKEKSFHWKRQSKKCTITIKKTFLEDDVKFEYCAFRYLNWASNSG